MKSAPDLQFEVRRSRIEAALVSLIAVLAIVALWLSRTPVIAQIAATALIVLALAAHIRHQMSRTPKRCQLQPDRTWRIQTGSTEFAAQLTDSRDLGMLIALQFTPEHGRRIDIALWPDSITSDTRRRLRVWLGRGAG